MRVVRSIAVEAGDEQHGRYRLRGTGGDGHADVDRDVLALLFRAECVRDKLFGEWVDPVSRCFHVCGFLGFPGLGFDGGVHDWEAGDAVEGGDAEVEGGCFGVVLGRRFGLGFGEEGVAGGEESGGVVVCVGIVDVVLQANWVSRDGVSCWEAG